MKKFLKIVIGIFITAATMALQACNTTKGAGQDIENAGEAIKDSAAENGAD